MTNEEVMRLALEAGMEQDGDNFFSPKHEEMDVHISDLKRFADLVVEQERKEFAQYFVFIARKSIAQERGACRRVCEELSARYLEKSDEVENAFKECADAIKARGNT